MLLRTGIKPVGISNLRFFIRAQIHQKSILNYSLPYRQSLCSKRQFTSSSQLLNKINQHSSDTKVTNDKPEADTKTSPTAILKDEIYTLPNILTMTRIVATPLIGYYIYTGQSVLSMSMFTYACVTDFLDGFIARTFNMKSILGTILDPIADKLLMGVCTIALSLVHTMPSYMAAIIIGKDFMLAMMGIYYRYVTLPAPKTFNRLINLGIPTVRVEPNLLSKVNTGLQMVYVVGLVFQTQLEPMIANYDFYFGNYELLVAATTVLSGLSYVFSSKSIKKII